MLQVGEPAWQDKQCEQCSKDFQCADSKQAITIPTGCHVHGHIKKKNLEKVIK